MSDAAHILEFEIILEKLADLAVSALGKERIEELPPFYNEETLRPELERVTEAKSLLEFSESFPLSTFSDLRPQLKRAEVYGAFLDPKEFLECHHFLIMVRQIKTYFEEHPEKYLQLAKVAGGLHSLTELEKSIGRIIDEQGEVKDRASETLSKLRREIQKNEGRVRRRMDAVLSDMSAKGYLQEDALAFRDGRLVIPMKEGNRGRLKGVVVDQSSSGATLYIEPLDVLEMNNDIRRLKSQERQEVERILKALTDEFREHQDEIAENLEIAAELDSLMARARLSSQLRGVAADIATDTVLDLKDARHPLLELKENLEVMPLSLQLGDEVKTLIITGPNAGGKTVALKTVGLLSLMHGHGMHVPAREGSVLPIFSRIFADIGDQQSIEQDLSTFSSHIARLKMILEDLDEHSLILLDEIGSATDPAEGSALAESILLALTERSGLTIATTHMGSLMVFAHELPGFENGSMAFDQGTLRPTYRFQPGLPGSSYAFEIAERLGIPHYIVDSAKDRMGEERGKLDHLILHLEENLQRTSDAAAKAEINENRLSGLVALYQSKLDELEKAGNERVERTVQEAEEALKEANATIERMVREIRESQAAAETIKNTKAALDVQKKKVRALTKKKEPVEAGPCRNGGWVAWTGHSGRGQIVSEPDKSGRVLVQWSGMRLRVPLKDLKPTQVPENKSRTASTRYSLSREVSNEVDLRGMSAEEALEAVDQYLSDVALSGFSQVGIIHGKGTGVLRREVSRHLKGHSLVKSQRLGNWNEGDTGVTIVELK